ncbi:hypothetical protein ACFLU1_02180 [Chloroflexota bacterium]
MKKRLLFAVVVFLSLLVVGCGIPQEDHDAVIAERDAAKTEITSLTSELADVKGELADVKGELDDTESSLASRDNELATAKSDLASTRDQVESAQSSASTARSQLSSYKSDLNSIWTSLEKRIELAAYLDLFWAAAAVGDDETGIELTENMATFVDAVGDAELSQLWQDAMNVDFETNFYNLMIRTIELLGENVDAFKAELSR